MFSLKQDRLKTENDNTRIKKKKIENHPKSTHKKKGWGEEIRVKVVGQIPRRVVRHFLREVHVSTDPGMFKYESNKQRTE